MRCLSILRSFHASLVYFLCSPGRTFRPASWMRSGCLSFAYAVILSTFACLPVIAQGSFPPPSAQWFSLPITAAFTGLNYTRAFSQSVYPTGTVIVTITGYTSGGSNCLLTFNFGGTITGNVTTPATLSVGAGLTLGNGNTIYRLGPANNSTSIATVSQPFISATPSFSCTTYPVSGTFNLEVIPDISTNPTYTQTAISGNASTVLKTAPGFLQSIVINNPGATWLITVFDNTACSGGQLFQVTPTVTTTLTYNDTLTTGLCITTSGTTPGNISVIFR